MQASHRLNTIQTYANRDGFIAFYTDKTNDATGFLGNFHKLNNFVYKNQHFTCSEAAFQAQKFNKPLKNKFSYLNGKKAFNVAQKHQNNIKPRWNQKKDKIMEDVVFQKFAQSKKLQKLLLATGSAYLVEHNEAKGRDNYWSDNGDGTGQNKLGKTLMKVRQRLGGAGVVSRPKKYYKFLKNEHAKKTSQKVANRAKTCIYPHCHSNRSPGHLYCGTTHATQCIFNQCTKHRNGNKPFCSKAHAGAYLKMKKNTCLLPTCNKPKQHGFFDACGKKHGKKLDTLHLHK